MKSSKLIRNLVWLSSLSVIGLGSITGAHAQYLLTDDGHIAMDGATDWDSMNNSELETIVGGSAWATQQPSRADILEQAMAQDEVGLCGDSARSAYDADSGAQWCTEYARTIYLWANVPYRNCAPPPQYDDARVPAPGCDYLESFTSVTRLVAYFESLGGWTDAGNVQPGQLQPGDYIALTTDGQSFNHSVLVIAISDDYRYIWTSEGNYGDCVAFVRRDFFIDGQLNPIINGVGNVDALFNARTQSATTPYDPATDPRA
jgi:hypothetical protein